MSAITLLQSHNSPFDPPANFDWTCVLVQPLSTCCDTRGQPTHFPWPWPRKYARRRVCCAQFLNLEKLCTKHTPSVLDGTPNMVHGFKPPCRRRVKCAHHLRAPLLQQCTSSRYVRHTPPVEASVPSRVQEISSEAPSVLTSSLGAHCASSLTEGGY